jgi:hypothetical protein
VDRVGCFTVGLVSLIAAALLKRNGLARLLL